MKDVNEEEMGDCILREEFNQALKYLKNKTPGIDEVPAEPIQNASDKAKDRLYQLTCLIYEE